MGLFSKLMGKGFDDYIEQARAGNILVVDVREPGEFARGHVPGAVNVPLAALGDIAEAAPDKTKTLYVHCLSGIRSARACRQLSAMGYADAVNIGGINSYHGPVER